MDPPELGGELSSQLEEGILISQIDDKRFLPLDFLAMVINKRSVEMELKDLDVGKQWLRESPELPGRITGHAKKVFAALALMDKTGAIRSLLDEGLTDEYLPLSQHSDHEGLLSRNGEMHFPFSKWRVASVNEFVRRKQWLFMAPVLDTSGRLIKVDPECPLPFVDSEIVDNGAAGIVHRAKLHPAHQNGYSTETVDLQVAVKQFLRKSDFIKEDDILQQIKSLQHVNIIRHFASIERGDKGYIVFPWADRGNLQEFWESEPETSPSRVLWSLRQMLGLSKALHLLHEQFQCRHGDLKPANILCVTSNGELMLKFADFGVSRIHLAPTMYRKSPTMSNMLTPSYQGPEVEFENTNKSDVRPRSRKYDIWSLGCVFLEFSLWLLHGPKGIEGFATARGRGTSSNETSRPLYEVTDKAAKVAKVHELVSETVEKLQVDPRCEGESALAALLSLVKDRMLQPEVDDRPLARENPDFLALKYTNFYGDMT
ncbi:hypothetical protein S40288_07655 [Stachybotrys chartarum IBT 40288]|nr:hypothetical protein S40288_07655 [Stachybotrys chartarum IBT 40288]